MSTMFKRDNVFNLKYLWTAHAVSLVKWKPWIGVRNSMTNTDLEPNKTKHQLEALIWGKKNPATTQKQEMTDHETPKYRQEI